MPRFGTKSLLIVFGIIAVWFATFGVSATSYASVMAAQDFRRSMLFFVLVIVVSMAWFTRGRRRVYWATFAIVMLLCGGLNLQRPLYRYVPEFAWQQVMSVPGISYAQPPAPARVTRQGQIVYSPTYGATGGIMMPVAPHWAAVSETLAAAWTFALAALSGVIAATIYARTGSKANVEASPSARQIVEQELQIGRSFAELYPESRSEGE